jgi:hypothetical protein
MKKIFVFLMAVILLGGLTLSAQAVTVLDPSNGELNLYQIVADPAFGGLTGYASSQAFANAFPIVSTLPANMSYEVTAYTRFASFTQTPGIYTAGNGSSGTFFTSLSPSGDGIFTSPNVYFSAGMSPVGFKDQINGGQYTLFTEAALNQGGLANGLIFQISPTHYIVAFEDGAGAGSLGDQDYNDLVLNISTSAVPIPAAVILLGSGLLGMVGLRRKFMG